MSEYEVRTVEASFQVKDNVIKGMFIKYDHPMELRTYSGSVIANEVYERDTFKESIDDIFSNNADFRVNYNHDISMILGRVSAGTARLVKDNDGLGFEVDLADTQFDKDLIVRIKRGDINGCSIEFREEEADVITADNDDVSTVIYKKAKLLGVAITPEPAYKEAILIERCSHNLQTLIETKGKGEKMSDEDKKEDSTLKGAVDKILDALWTRKAQEDKEIAERKAAEEKDAAERKALEEKAEALANEKYEARVFEEAEKLLKD